MARPLRCLLSALAAITVATASHADEPFLLDHQQQTIEGWTVHVDTRLLPSGEEPTSASRLGSRAIRLLKNKLYELTFVLPDDRCRDLRTIPIFLDLDHPLQRMQYHPNINWLREHNYDPAMAKAVHIPSVHHFLDIVGGYRQPSAVLHELAHAYHDQFLGFDEPRVRIAQEKIAQGGRYESVLHISGRMRRHYALTNHKEFFAEMSEAYLGTNDFFPFVRGELMDFDPDVADLLHAIWLAEADETSSPAREEE